MRHAIFIKQCILRGQSTSNERLISHVSKKPTVCKSCQKEIQTYEKAWIHMPLPANGMTNIKKYIELEGEIYCSSCVEIMNKK